MVHSTVQQPGGAHTMHETHIERKLRCKRNCLGGSASNSAVQYLIEQLPVQQRVEAALGACKGEAVETHAARSSLGEVDRLPKSILREARGKHHTGCNHGTGHGCGLKERSRESYQSEVETLPKATGPGSSVRKSSCTDAREIVSAWA